MAHSATALGRDIAEARQRMKAITWRSIGVSYQYHADLSRVVRIPFEVSSQNCTHCVPNWISDALHPGNGEG
jgi:hypothetical protein